LQEKHIFSLSNKRIAISGKIRVFCFEKTGTLTQEGLNFVGVVVPSVVLGVVWRC
jgi:cation-transporting ATPase 13A3/4/5